MQVESKLQLGLGWILFVESCRIRSSAKSEEQLGAKSIDRSGRALFVGDFQRFFLQSTQGCLV